MKARQKFLAVFLKLVLLVSAASAQVPELPPQWFQQRLPGTPGAALNFCVDERISGWWFDSQLARALADSLLIDSELITVDRRVVTELEFEALYVDLVDRCTAYLGLKSYADSYPDWLMFTRPYYVARFVLLAQNEAYRRMQDIPSGSRIGVVQGTEGDIRFLMYNNTLPADRRWRRVPLGNPTIALPALLAGSTEALIIWEPDWFELKQRDPSYEQLHVVEAPLISDPWIGVSAGLVVDRTFELSLLDQAIAALTADGTIGRLLEEHDYPGRIHQP